MLGWPLRSTLMWVYWDAHTEASHEAHGILLIGWWQTYISPMRAQMYIGRGTHVGPTSQLVASLHGSHHWQLICGPWECPSLAIHGAHGILLSGKFVKKMTINKSWVWISEVIRPVDKNYICNNSSNGHGMEIPTKRQHFTIMKMTVVMETRHI